MEQRRSSTQGTRRLLKHQLMLAYEVPTAEPEEWDYATANTKTHTHGYHTYPAMMIPQVARRLIRLYGKPGQTLLDPFCGSGTSLVEARLAGLHAYGVDINPFAIFLARTKTTLYNPEHVRLCMRELEAGLNSTLVANQSEGPQSQQKTNLEVPRFFNIDYWFLPEVQIQLATLREAIHATVPPELRDFFWVAFAHTVRECSNVRKGEYKLFRIPQKALESYQPDVVGTFWAKVVSNLQGLVEFYEQADPTTRVEVLHTDMRQRLPLEDACIDVVVTSPPYGDSQTTVAYGQFSRLALQWMGFPDEDAKRIDREALGGRQRPSHTSYHSATLSATLQMIAERDVRRARQVQQFYDDFADCLEEIARVCRPGAYGCFVVGNRTVKQVRIPTDQILREIAECFGWHYQITYHRRIPNKRMPLRNSPSNIPGIVGDTMTEEHIVVLRKV